VNREISKISELLINTLAKKIFWPDIRYQFT